MIMEILLIIRNYLKNRMVNGHSWLVIFLFSKMGAKDYSEFQLELFHSDWKLHLSSPTFCNWYNGKMSTWMSLKEDDWCLPSYFVSPRNSSEMRWQFQHNQSHHYQLRDSLLSTKIITPADHTQYPPIAQLKTHICTWFDDYNIHYQL